MKKNIDFTLSSTHIKYIIVATVLFSLTLRLCIGMTFMNSFDTDWYLQWAKDIQNNFFTAYNGNVYHLDYPPLYLYPLYLVGMLIDIPVMAEYMPYKMLLIKFFPILFDVMIVFFAWFLFRKKNEIYALFGAMLWAFNPAAIYNSSNWGQTDSIMAFLLLITFWAYSEKKYVIGSVWFAVAICTKMQCLYFAPIILFMFIREKEFKKLLFSLAAGFGAVIAVFLPFMIGSGDILLPFRVYAEGFGSYPYINLNAFNLYGLFDFNWVEDSTKLFWIIDYSTLSTLLLVATVALVAYLSIFGKRFSIWISSLVYINCIFMLTTRQHERYQYMVLILALIAFVIEKDFRFFKLFTGFSVIVFLNHCVLLAKIHDGNAPWTSQYETIQAICSFVNILLFVYCMYASIKFVFPKQKLE